MISSDLPLFEQSVNGEIYRLSDEVLGVLSQSPPELRPMAYMQVGRMLGGYMLRALSGKPTLSEVLNCAYMVTWSTWSTRDMEPFLRGVVEGFLEVEPD